MRAVLSKSTISGRVSAPPSKSYTIRSLPANALDSAFCLVLGQHAVHAGMAGRTDIMIGRWNGKFIHVPMELGVSTRKQLDSEVWQRVLETTGQPASLTG